MDTENERLQAETRRFEAERLKLELEAKEIERRLGVRWWQGQKLAQYLLAIVVAAALLFGWTRVYLEPILRSEAELNKLAEQRNSAVNELLEAQSRQLRQQQTEITNDRDRLKQEADSFKAEMSRLVAERDKLRNEQKGLEKKQKGLQARIGGLTVDIRKIFFSILNSKDPINELKNSYGWNVSSDNFFGGLGYYLKIKHNDVRSGKTIIVGRKMEVDDLIDDMPNKWREYIENIISQSGPVLALDFSYFGLYADKNAPVGGIIYRQPGEDIEFYAPLSEWSDRLGALFPNE